MSPIVNLSNKDLWLARQLAAMRSKFSRANGVATQKIDPNSSDVDIDFTGILGEMAVAKFFDGSWPSIEDGPDAGFDTYIGPYRCQVKTTKHEHGKLLLESAAEMNDTDIAILAVVLEPSRVKLAGWCSRRHFEQHAKPFNAYGSAGVAIDQSRLRSIGDLLVGVREQQLNRAS